MGSLAPCTYLLWGGLECKCKVGMGKTGWWGKGKDVNEALLPETGYCTHRESSSLSRRGPLIGVTLLRSCVKSF